MLKFSLRQLLLLVAVVATAVVSLYHASALCQALVGLFAMIVVFGAAVAGIFDRGPRRAFAVGLALVMLAYGVLILNGRKTSSSSGTIANQELRGTGSLPTTVILQHLHQVLFTVPDSNIPGVAARPARSIELIPFARTGHLWFALIFGYLGGCFARFVYLRRTKEQSHPSKE